MTTIEDKIQKEHSLARYCTYQVGGPADYFLEAQSIEDLVEALEWTAEKGIPYFVFGGGSNLLFDDAGFRGLVIRMRAGAVKVVDELFLEAEAGAMSAVLVQKALESSLTGLEAWNGLPGTVGGAVYGNAGCFEVETKDILEWADVYVPGEGVKRLSVEELEYSYRNSALKKMPGVVVLKARFKLQKGDSEVIKEEMKRIAKLRIQKQPPGLSTGSFFKNPSPEKPAGWLIDQAGLKGYRMGSVQISEQHANFLVNKGGARAKDILALAAFVQAQVQEKFGIDLEPEIIYNAPEVNLTTRQ